MYNKYIEYAYFTNYSLYIFHIYKYLELSTNIPCDGIFFYEEIQ